MCLRILVSLAGVFLVIYEPEATADPVGIALAFSGSIFGHQLHYSVAKKFPLIIPL